MIKFLLILLLLVVPVRGGIEFDGTDDQISTGTASIGTSIVTFTMSCWFKADTIGALDYIIAAGPAGDRGLLVSFSSNVLTYIWEGGSDEYSASTGLSLSTGVWYFGAVSISSSAATVYLYDGSTLNSWTNTKGHAARNLNQTWYFGADPDDPTGRKFDGVITDVRFFPSTLSTAQIEGLARGRLKVVKTSESHYWPLDDVADGTSADGDTLKDRAGTADATGNDGATNGTLLGRAETYLSYP